MGTETGDSRRNIIIPLRKEKGKIIGILTDDGLDRSRERMHAGLIETWASEEKALTMLADHENRMENFIGAWTNREIVYDEEGHAGLKMEPNFFSDSANPRAQMIKRQVEEAFDMGLYPGLSVGFIPIKGYSENGEYVHTEGTLLETSFIPIQCNSRAFATIVKRFDFYKIRKGVDMENEKKEKASEEAIAAIAAKIAELENRIKALEDASAAGNEKSANEVKAIRENLENENKKRLELEAKYAKSITEMAKKIDETNKAAADAKKAVENPRGRIPKSMIIEAMQGKGSNETFSATKAWAKQHNIEMEDG